MKQNTFYKQFLTEFEPQFQKVVHDLFEKSHDTNFSTGLISTFLNPLLPYIQEGKRVRPFLIAVGANSLDEKVIHAGIAFELLHTFALVHDDIMDGATRRRNVPTVHEYFKQNGIPGESSAMLVGDFLLASANEHMSEHVSELMPLFTQMQRFLCVGQFYEMLHWGKTVPREVSEHIALFKSAHYTFMYPLQFGLFLNNKDIHALDKYAHFTGLGFQVRDDWLDIAQEIESFKDKNLDSKNGVANITQLTLQKNNGDMKKTKKEVESLLTEYRGKAEVVLKETELDERQINALRSLLHFSTTL